MTLQEQACEKARKMLEEKNFPWFEGWICTDKLPHEHEIEGVKGVEDVAHNIYCDTIYWDGCPSDFFK